MTHFDHRSINSKRWSTFYERHSFSDAKKEFKMILPPPNVTGILHLGHALNITIQDALARYHWLKGEKVTWIPGTDHAGIATQVVVERKIMAEEGITRHDLGREKFLEKVWTWKEEHADHILSQIKQLSPLIDYSKEQFTMNEDLSQCVTNTFCELYHRKLIYRSKRMVPYCCKLGTVLSNIEIDKIEISGPGKHVCPGGIKATVGVLYDIKFYAVEPRGEIDSIVISTTRPETMFGDVCITVHPEDERFHDLKDMHFKIPQTNIVIPLIYDTTVPKINIGTGAVKITPAHDPKDFDFYQRHISQLPLTFHEVIDDSGHMDLTSLKEKDLIPLSTLKIVDGKHRYIARNILIKQLEKSGHLVSKRPHSCTLEVCSRSGDILEPKLKPQWFLDTRGMSKRAVSVVETGALEILDMTGAVSPSYKKVWKDFLEEARPWCISRQLWWGHRIPAYSIHLLDETVPHKEELWVVSPSLEEAHIRAEMLLRSRGLGFDYTLVQDEDVLDTWFSSGLYPFSILSGEMMPLDVLETGKDILFFWVARMVMLSLELKDKLPFQTVLLHNMVRNKSGKKMSKSLGNAIDPTDIIHGISRKDMENRVLASSISEKEKKVALKEIRKTYPNGIKSYGVDSLRMGLLSQLKQNTDIHLDVKSFKLAHALLNKVWHILNLYEKLNKDFSVPSPPVEIPERVYEDIKEWINHHESHLLNFTLYEGQGKRYRPNIGCLYENFYTYIMRHFAPFYLESIKVLTLDPNQKDIVLDHLKEKIMRILFFLHPMAPEATCSMFSRLGWDVEELKIPEECFTMHTLKSNLFDEVLSIVSQINKRGVKEDWIEMAIEISTIVLKEFAPIITHLTVTPILFEWKEEIVFIRKKNVVKRET